MGIDKFIKIQIRLGWICLATFALGMVIAAVNRNVPAVCGWFCAALGEHKYMQLMEHMRDVGRTKSEADSEKD